MNTSNASRLKRKRLWTFDPSALFEGDVILEFGGTIKSTLISAFDGGPYSHALIWAGNTDFVESVGGGVRILSFQRVLVDDPGCWVLLRQPDRSLGDRAAQAARRMVAKRYNTQGAFAALAPGAGRARPEAAFCSELVAQAYLDAGLDVVPGLPPQKVTPRVLFESSVFRKLDPPLVECDMHMSPELLEAANRDKAYENSLMDVEARVSREAFAEIQHLVSSLPPGGRSGVKHPPGNLPELLDALSCSPVNTSRPVMDALVDRLHEGGYFHLFDQPFVEVRSHFLHCGMQLRYGNLPRQERDGLCAYLRRVGETYSPTIQRFLRNAQVCEQLFVANPHALWRELAQMYHRNYQKTLILRSIACDLASEEWA